MKIKNEEVGIKIGNKEHKFRNMIMDTYLDVFAENFTNFKYKGLPYCLISFTKLNYGMNEQSTSMEYDVTLELSLDDDYETITPQGVVNKYYYRNEEAESPMIKDFIGKTIKSIGFADYNYETHELSLRAYLDVSRYNITIQENQPLIISRVDKITTDLNFWASSNLIKGPIHLTKNGILDMVGYNYNRIIPKLYSIGFGILPYTINKEYLAENLIIQKTGTGIIEINNQLDTGYRKNLYFSDDLYMSDNLLLKQANYPFLIYKFKLYEETYPDPEEDVVLVDTQRYYTQYQELRKYGKINLKIKYERG